MKIILHGGPADGHEYYVPDLMNHFAIEENLEADWFSYTEPPESMEPTKTQTHIYWRTDQTDEEGRTVFAL
jgi:hypothetical protein